MKAPGLESQVLPPPPGIIGSLRAGFDVTAANVTSILMPLALDLLLWLGPRLSMNRLVQPVLKEMGSLAASSGLQPTDVTAALDLYRQFFQDFNLLMVLRTLPVGVSSLMSGRMPTQSPLGVPTMLQVDSPGHLLGLVFVLTLAGWMLGGLYFHWVAGLVVPKAPAPAPASASRAIVQTVLYSTVCLIVAWTLGLPVAVLVYVMFAINTFLGQGVLLLLGFISLWLIVPLFFTPHGIFVRKQNAIASFVGSFQVMRFTLPTSSLFVLTVVLLGIGLNLLWSVPTGDSWLALVGILGHAFISTALLASSFVYYQDMTAWLQTVLARIRASMPTQQA
jgi:hypothetical protein